jgi:hypothetical protein
MTTKSRISAALAVLTLATSLAIPTSSAQAGHHGGWGIGIGAGIVGAAVVGAAVANSAPYGGYYVDGYRRCGFERQYNSLGYYIGTVKVCRVY